MNYSFGQPNAAAPAAGPVPAAAGTLFGAKPATTAPPATGFGAFGASAFTQPAQLTQLTQPPAGGFGAPAQPTFGAPAQPQPAPAAQQPSTLFGAPVPATSTPQTGLFGAPQPATSAPQTGLFGATQPTTGLFGANPASSAPATTSTTSSLFSGIQASQPSTGLTLGAKPPGVQFDLGAASTAATGTGTGFGLSLAPAATTSAGLSFPSLTPASSAPSAFTLGGSGGLFNKPATGLAPAATAAPTASVGLGGIDTTSSSSGLTGLAGTANGRQEAKTVKENPIPNEVAQSVESFRQFVKQQKSLSSDIARYSSKPLLKVQEDIEALKQLLASSTTGLQRCRSIADKLKADTAKGLQHTEMAQRTHDTPPGLQYDNNAPLQYFAELVSGFERDIQLFRQEIENAERHVHSRCQTTGLTPTELTQAMRRLYDSLVALAGRLHVIHSQVKTQKEQYLSMRKYMLNDISDVFEEAARLRASVHLALGKDSGHSARSTAGPTPFSALSSQHGLGLFTAGASASARQNFPAVGPLGVGWSSSVIPTGSLGVSSQPLLLNPQPDNQFQLQKPPVGNKRGKR